MKKRLKKLQTIALILFVVTAFGAITAVTLIIAQGGKITPNGISQTGIIRINAEPDAGIRVYVDDKKISLTDKRIEGLEEGEYLIRVEKEGFLSWEKKVFVTEGIVKDVYVTMLKEELELEQLTNTDIERIFFSPDGNYVYYVILNAEEFNQNGIWRLKLTQNTLESVGIVDVKSEKIAEMTKSLRTILEGNYDLKIAPNNSRFLLTTDDTLYIYETATAELRDISDPSFLGFVPNTFSWLNEGNSIIIEQVSMLFEVNLRTYQTNLITLFRETEPVYAVNGESVVFYQNGTYYSYKNNEKKPLKSKFDLPIPTALWLSERNDDLLYIKDATGTLHFTYLDKGIERIGAYNLLKLSNDGQNALLKDTAGNIYNFREEIVIATDEFTTSIELIESAEESFQSSYQFSPDNNYLIQMKQTSQGDAEETKFNLIGLYGKNSYELLKTTQYVNDTNFSLVNSSKEFIVLLSDTIETEEEQAPLFESNIYKIELVG